MPSSQCLPLKATGASGALHLGQAEVRRKAEDHFSLSGLSNPGEKLMQTEHFQHVQEYFTEAPGLSPESSTSSDANFLLYTFLHYLL